MPEIPDTASGYIYITSTGADPAARQNLNDPQFGRIPTLGACMPNIRRFVRLNDFIFVISGSVPGLRQYVVGGLQVAEKVNMLDAYDRLPEYRLHRTEEGRVEGNIILTPDGKQHPLDTHKPQTFQNRVANYIIGKNPLALTTPQEVARGRAETMNVLSDVFGKNGNRVIDIMGRWRKLDAAQITRVVTWLQDIKNNG